MLASGGSRVKSISLISNLWLVGAFERKGWVINVCLVCAWCSWRTRCAMVMEFLEEFQWNFQWNLWSFDSVDPSMDWFLGHLVGLQRAVRR